MNKAYDIVAIGECLIDMIPTEKDQAGHPLWGANPGGAPANVAAMVARLGGRSAFIGKVGADGFGDFLRENLSAASVDVSGLISDNRYNTTLALVQLDKSGDRSFSFYRKPGADIMLSIDDLPNDIIGNCKILHFGSVSLTDSPSREATYEAAKAASKSGAVISYDPNYRPLLWESPEAAIREMKKGLALADIVKVSDEEAIMLTGTSDLTAAARTLIESGASLVFVTLGAEGAIYATRRFIGRLPAYKVNTVDTTGAGDTFFGSILTLLCEDGLTRLEALTEGEVIKLTKVGTAAGSLCTTKRGAIPAMPGRDQIEALISGGQ